MCNAVTLVWGSLWLAPVRFLLRLRNLLMVGLMGQVEALKLKYRNRSTETEVRKLKYEVRKKATYQCLVLY